MAYFTQTQKQQMAPKIKAICAKYGVKGSLSVDNHSTVVFTIKSGILDFIGNYNETGHYNRRGINDWNDVKDNMGINPYWYKEHFNNTKILDFLNEVFTVLNNGNYDDSDIMTDYFSVGWYVDVKIGKWNKPYILI